MSSAGATAITPVDQVRAEYQRVSQGFVGKSCERLNTLRKQALEAFAETGFPTIRDEDWKYTNVQSIAQREFKLADAGQSVSEGLLAELRYEGLDSYQLVFVNGHYAADHSHLEGLPKGVTLVSLSEIIDSQYELLNEHLANLSGQRLGGFSALNTACMSDGVLLHLAAGSVLDKPVHLLFISTHSEQPLMSSPRVLIVAEANSQCQVIEHYASEEGSRNLSNSVTEISAASGAQVEHCKVQVESSQAYHIGNLFIRQSSDSRVLSHSLALGARLSRNGIHADLAAPGAEICMNGLYMCGGRQHVDHHTSVDHLEPNTHSEEFYKGILDGHARGVFNGRVMVHKDAQKIEAHQHNRNLLLSANAEVDTKPELEIYADDVKCSHGATVGQLDQKAMFYLRSRGITEEAARNLLTFAFADDVIQRINIPAVRTRLEEAVIGQLSDSEELKELI